MILRIKKSCSQAYLRTVSAVSANYLERVADPASAFHADYLDYKNGRIGRDELIVRLPHIAMIGDSLSKDVYISSPLSTLWRARTRHGNNWFLDTDPSPASIYSVFERLDRFTPLVATEYGGLGALVDSAQDRQWLSRKILRTRDFSGQVSQLLSHKRFPDLTLIWIGHNNVDWAWQSPPAELKQPEKRLQRLSGHFRENYTRQMRRLIARGKTESHQVAIVVFGLADFGSFFKARKTAETLREKNAKLYPYLGSDSKYFISMRPAYRSQLLRLVRMVNEGLSAMVDQINRELEPQHFPNVHLRYCDALARVDLGRVEVIHAVGRLASVGSRAQCFCRGGVSRPYTNPEISWNRGSSRRGRSKFVIRSAFAANPG
jgi:lysophospholipase L1-like esterase